MTVHFIFINLSCSSGACGHQLKLNIIVSFTCLTYNRLEPRTGLHPAFSAIKTPSLRQISFWSSPYGFRKNNGMLKCAATVAIFAAPSAASGGLGESHQASAERQERG
jgi:hypothetical protein